MTESKETKCLCGKTLYPNIWGRVIDDQWFCGECLTKIAIKAIKLEKRLVREIERLGVELNDVKCARQTMMRHKVATRLVGERSKLKFVLKMLKG